jgi:hypothetical protein
MSDGNTKDWVDGVRGRTLRWLMTEEIRADLAILTGRVETMCASRGLALAMKSDRLYSRILDLVAARVERPQGILVGRDATQGSKPKGWTSEEEAIWQEWLETTLSPAVWNWEVFAGLDDAEMEWGVDAGRWREELVSLLPYWIVRSRDLFMEIDPRPIGAAMEEESVGSSAESGEVWR